MMERLAYDLHIHSCLSPCGDNESTPNNILNMARLNGLDVIALTDHNSCKNCPAIIEARDRMELPILVLPGMELCTAEEIHVVCLFDTLEKAMGFDEYVYTKTMPVLNRPEKFGEQRILDCMDEIIGTEPRLLVTAADIPLTEVGGLMERFGGVAFPAHIDRPSYSILSALGEIPPECTFQTAEVYDIAKHPSLAAAHPALTRMRIVTNSDAHYLWDISEGERQLSAASRTPAAVLNYLRGL